MTHEETMTEHFNRRMDDLYFSVQPKMVVKGVKEAEELKTISVLFNEWMARKAVEIAKM